ncbi:tripartite motif-containing protein 35-like [Notolabrus celidotus]|uniref:tripartite motif-containing protein 35-like n=1 Tax=Notolabrus celidotus TaxID=1203425 RepID=UPI0014906716|nr:tripartite motif-containing protein 35-like [Notolabrus celidotus]
MASMPEADLTCAVCQDIFKDPVILTCSHSFCKACLQDWWRGKQLQECPVCKRRSSRSDPPCNLALKNLCAAFQLNRDQRSSAGSESLCSLHAEKLKLFCLEHEEPACVICRDSKRHNGHTFRPIDEAAKDRREELLESLKPLQDKLKVFEGVRGNCVQTAGHIKVQATNTEKQIKEQFKKLHKSLEEEEEARICALREEEEQKSLVMKGKIDALNTEIAALSETIRVTEDELRAEDVSFLQNYKAAVRRVQQRPMLEDPDLVSGALIDEAKHLGNLSFNIWNKMNWIEQYPVVLDPNSAHPDLVLSEDLTSVRRGGKQNLPDTPGRMSTPHSVLGSKGFQLGTRSWAVEVGDSVNWSLGVAAECGEADGKTVFCMWTLQLSDGQYKAVSPLAGPMDLQVEKKPERVRVDLDFNRGRLSFTDRDEDTHLHTFTHTFVFKTVFPYIRNGDEGPVRLLPRGEDDEEDDAEFDDDDSDEDYCPDEDEEDEEDEDDWTSDYEDDEEDEDKGDEDSDKST